MKRIVLLTVIPLALLSTLITSFTPSVHHIKRPACSDCGTSPNPIPPQAPLVADISVTVSGSSMTVTWDNSAGDYFIIGGYSGYPFQTDCIYNRPGTNGPISVQLPYNGTGNLRITAFCGPCGNALSSDVSGAKSIP